MRFLVDADLPRRTADVIRNKGHEAIDVRDVGLGSAPDPDIAAHARREGLCLLTGDLGFADVRNYPPEGYAGIAVLRLPRDATADVIAAIVEELLANSRVLERLPGRLAIVSPGSVRLRPK